MRARRVGEHSLLVECAGAAEVAATYAVLTSRADDLGATDVVPAARTVLIDGVSDVPAALERLVSLHADAAAELQPDGPVVELATRYDGEDLTEVARQWDVGTAEVVRLHQEATFRVQFCGFAPGFAYCTGLPDGLTVARRADPRPRVPAGSVALAGEYTAVYPSASPGGWQLIGTTRAELWRPGADVPALLAPGTRVRFVDG